MPQSIMLSSPRFFIHNGVHKNGTSCTFVCDSSRACFCIVRHNPNFSTFFSHQLADVYSELNSRGERDEQMNYEISINKFFNIFSGGFLFFQSRALKIIVIDNQLGPERTRNLWFRSLEHAQNFNSGNRDSFQSVRDAYLSRRLARFQETLCALQFITFRVVFELMAPSEIAKHFLLYFNWKIPTSLSPCPHILSRVSDFNFCDSFSSSSLLNFTRSKQRSFHPNTETNSTIVSSTGDFNWNLWIEWERLETLTKLSWIQLILLGEVLCKRSIF